jgi:beta-glucosidase
MAAKQLHTFPKNFIFGTATASYQIEGAVTEDGRGESIWDRFSHTAGKIKTGETGDVACDHYHRVDEDIGLMKELGVQAYRFSIAWPRIIPDGEGAVNQKGLGWYSRLVDKLLAAGIEPWATMYHWDLPQALEEKYGGWRSRRTPEAFRRYADVIVAHLGDRVKRWMTLNEMECTIGLGYRSGMHAPGATEPPAVVNQVQHHVLLAHGHGVRAVREHGGRGAKVGQAYNPGIGVPVYETAEHIEAAAKRFVDANGPMAEPMQRGSYPAKWLEKIGADAPKVEAGDMEIIASPTDFIGLNVYAGTNVEAADNADGYRVIDFPAGYPRAWVDWLKLMPQSLYWGLRHLHDLYGYRELYVTENGWGMTDKMVNGEVLDTDRVLYYREYLKAAAQTVAEKYPLKGYFAWTLMDNFEWAEGFAARFGLYYTDFATQRRTAKLGAKFYAACIKARQVL